MKTMKINRDTIKITEPGNGSYWGSTDRTATRSGGSASPPPSGPSVA